MLPWTSFGGKWALLFLFSPGSLSVCLLDWLKRFNAYLKGHDSSWQSRSMGWLRAWWRLALRPPSMQFTG
jgi:hypothetical protein